MPDTWGVSWLDSWADSWGLRTPIIPPVPPPPVGGPPIPGGGGTTGQGERYPVRIDYAEHRTLVAELRDAYRKVYDIADKDGEIADKAAAAVAEFVPTNAPDFPPPDVIDWEALAVEGRTFILRFRMLLTELQAALDIEMASRQAKAMALADEEDAIMVLLLN